jgi:REP element-mobilizing transposase RayT
MRSLRILKQDVWYEIHTVINNREPLFRIRQALALFSRVLDEAGRRFVFEIRRLCLADDLLSFYIRPADGLSLPEILKWLKQTFAVRYNVKTGRIGHIWGDRYKSVILEGDPPGDEKEEAAGEPKAVVKIGVRPRQGGERLWRDFSLYPPIPTTLRPRKR